MFNLCGHARAKTTMALAAFMAIMLSGTARAEDWKSPPRTFKDPLGVDLSGDEISRDQTFLTIGDPSAGGLSWMFHAHYPTLRADWRGYVGNACTDPPPIFSAPSCDPSLTYVLVWIGESATTFEPSGSSFINWSGTGSTLSLSGTTYTYTDSDGTIYTIDATNGLSGIKHPNGMALTISGSSVVSNTGFALMFDDTAHAVEAVNMLAHGCEPPSTCGTYDARVTLTDSTVTGYTYEVRDPANNAWEYDVDQKFTYEDPATHEMVHGPRTLWAFEDPTGYAFSTTRATRGGLTHFIDPRGTFTYSGQPAYAPPEMSYTNTTTDPSNNLMFTSFMNLGYGIGGFITDGLGRTTVYSVAIYNHGTSTVTHLPIAQWTQFTGVTAPEGDYTTYTYDSRGNVTNATRYGKPGSGLSESFTASYPSTCVNPVTCNQPDWTKDAKGNETDYTYDATHGGVLTVVLPADQNGLRRKTFNTYTAYDTLHGIIYRLTRSETCGLTATQLSTLTACPAATSTSVTTTDYGTSGTAPYTYKSFMPYSVTQTDGAGSLSATTTYTYDVMGNVTVVDGPRTDVDDRSYKTWDADRRVVCEIGVDPDGAGTLVRAMVRHVYDAAGRETETDTGTGASTTDCTPAISMAVAMKTLVTFDAAGRAVTTKTVSVP